VERREEKMVIYTKNEDQDKYQLEISGNNYFDFFGLKFNHAGKKGGIIHKHPFLVILSTLSFLNDQFFVYGGGQFLMAYWYFYYIINNFRHIR
jgi:hypothetical protein